MRVRPLALFLALTCAAWTSRATAQPSNSFSTLQSRVFDVLFPRDVGTPLYFSRTTLRFSDSASQIVIILIGRATGQGEVYHWRVRETDRMALSERIAKAFMDNRETTAAEIASGVRVETARTSIKAAPFIRMLDELKGIQLSPLLPSRVCLHDCPDYEFWHDTNQASVHYAFTAPAGNSGGDEWPHDRLVRWMLSVRSQLPKLLAEAADQTR